MAEYKVQMSLNNADKKKKIVGEGEKKKKKEGPAEI